VPSHSRLSLTVSPLAGLQQPHRQKWSKLNDAPQSIFALNVLPATTIPISGLGNGSEYAGRLCYATTHQKIRTEKVLRYVK